MFSTWTKLSQSCALFKLNYRFNMASVTTHGNGVGGWRVGCSFHNLLFSFQLFLATLPSTRRTSQAWGYSSDLKITLKLIFEVDSEFLFGNDFAMNSIFSLFHFSWVQTNGPLGALAPGRVPGASAGFVWKWGCPVGHTGWWKIYRERPGTDVGATAGRTRCEEPNGKQWDKKQRC